MTLVARKAGDGQKDFLIVSFKEVFINSVQCAGRADGELVEGVTFGFKHIGMAYRAQDEKGNLAGEVKFGWNPVTTEIT